MPLAVTVEAGENYPDNEAVTLAKLRKGATPSVAISGTVSSVDIQDGGITGAKLADTTIPPSKIGNATITGEANAALKGVILASGANSSDLDKFDELYAGKRNAFLIGSSTKTGETWTDEYLVKSKTLHTDSSFEVTDQTANDFTIKVKEDGIVKDMMADNSVGSSQLSNYAVTINSLAPGGGASSSGGIAEEDNTFWGGVLDFNPALESGDTGWHGKAGALQPTKPYQVLYSVSEGSRLSFANHPSIPKAWATVRQTTGTTDLDSTDTNVAFTIVAGIGVLSVTKISRGIYDFVLEKNKVPYETTSPNNSISAQGNGITVTANDASHLMPVTTTNVEASGDNYKARVVWVSQHATLGTFPNTSTTAHMFNPTFFQIQFF